MDNSIKIFKNDVFGEVRVAGTSEEPLFCLADAVIGSRSSCLIGELAKIISQNGFHVGQNRLFEWLRNNHYYATLE